MKRFKQIFLDRFVDRRDQGCRTSRIALIVVLVLTGLLTDQWRPEDTNRTLVVKAELLDLNVPGATPLVSQTRAARVLSINLTLSAAATSDNYTNIFSTSDGPRALRLELTHPKTLNLALGGIGYLGVSNEFSLNISHTIVLKGEDRKYLTLSIDGNVVFSGQGPQLHFENYGFDPFILGSGFGRQRTFQGQLSDVHLIADVIEKQPVRAFIRRVTALALVLGVLLLVRPLFNAQYRVAVVPSSTYAPFDLIGLLLVATLALLGFLLRDAQIGFGSWTVLLTTGLCIPGLLMGRWLVPVNFVGRRADIIATAVLAVTGLGAVGAAASKELNIGFLNGAITILATAAVFVTWPTRLAGYPHGFQAKQLLAFAASSIFMTLSVARLPNWLALGDQVTRAPFSTFAGLSLCLMLISGGFVLLWQGREGQASKRREVADLAIVFLGLLIFSILAFRSDSLFVEGSQFHWAYFIGPIQAVRAGGWLLWDAPSQYGFLPIVLASLMPPTSAWDAFYQFQGVILLATSMMMFSTIVNIGVPSVPAICVVIATVFFADPRGLIGPAPYPSSSGIRFLWCYVLLAIASKTFTGPNPSIPSFLRRCIVPWLLGVYWSAESLVYSTAIVLAPAAFHLLQSIVNKNGWVVICQRLRLMLWLPAILVISYLCLVSFYLVSLGHAPDVSMFFQYAIGYAGGFGALPVTFDGPVWVFLLLLACGVSCGFALLNRGAGVEGELGSLVAAMACVWVIMSYYLGRAAPDNVTALLPILSLCAMLILRSSLAKGIISTAQAGIAFTLVGFAIASSVWSTVSLEMLKNFRSMSNSIVPRLAAPNADLSNLLEEAGVSARSPISFYGYAASMPYVTSDSVATSYDTPFLFGPLQLLEEPISPTRREIIVRRFAERRTVPGFIVQKRGEAEDRFSEILTLIDRWYGVSTVHENGQYRIIQFEHR